MNNLRRWIHQFSFCLVLLFCGVALNATAQVNHYYVSPSGNDSNDGSSGRPWGTISHAVAAASIGSSGTVIHVANGTYSFVSGCPNDSGANVCFNRGGNSTTARLVLQCDAGTSSATAAVGQCKITGGSAGIFMNTGNFIDVVGFDIGNAAGMQTGVKVLGNCGQPVSSCGNSVHIIGNYVHDLGGSSCPSNGAIEIGNNHGDGVTDGQILRNTIMRFAQDPSGSCNLTHGIYVNTGRVIVQNNIIVQVPTYGITYYSSACFGVVSNNVVINAKGGLVIGTDGIGTSCANQGSNTINNNYFGNIRSKSSIVFSAGAPQCTSSMPNYIGNNMSDGSAPDFSSGASSCDIISPSSMTHVSGASFFVNYQVNGTGDYHLKSSSPGMGAGTKTCSTGTGAVSPCAPEADFEGVVADLLSIGAYAGSAASTATSPAAPTNLTATVQ